LRHVVPWHKVATLRSGSVSNVVMFCLGRGAVPPRMCQLCHPSRGGIWHGAKAVFINRSTAKILGQNERKGPD